MAVLKRPFPVISISGQQQPHHQNPAHIIGGVDDPHVVENSFKTPAPEYAENTVGNQRCEHRIEGVAHSAEDSDICLIDRVEPVQGEGKIDSLKSVAQYRFILSKNRKDSGSQ